MSSSTKTALLLLVGSLLALGVILGIPITVHNWSVEKMTQLGWLQSTPSATYNYQPRHIAVTVPFERELENGCQVVERGELFARFCVQNGDSVPNTHVLEKTREFEFDGPPLGQYGCSVTIIGKIVIEICSADQPRERGEPPATPTPLPAGMPTITPVFR